MTSSSIIREESAGSIRGVRGRFFNVVRWGAPVREGKPVTLANQRWLSESRKVSGYGPGGEMQVTIRHDDNCRNGHETFSVTAEVSTAASRKPRSHGRVVAGGCMHDAIAKVFPELAPLIRWHLVSVDAPMHYAADAVYLAGDRDHWGRRKGDVSEWSHGVRFGTSPVTHRLKKALHDFIAARLGTGEFQVQAVPYVKSPGRDYDFSPKYTLAGFGGDKWHECPFDDKTKADEFARALNTVPVELVRIPVAWSEGKARELEAARRVACWPDATDAELMQEPEVLKAALAARLPALLAEFRRDVEGAGFIYQAPAV